MKLSRAFAFAAGFAVWTASVLVCVEFVFSLGFPDGFISELQRAERNLAYIFISISIVLGLFFVYLGGATAAENGVGRKLTVAACLYLIFIAVLILADNFYRANLTGSGGG